MPPIAEKLFCPLYRIEVLITEKVHTEKVHRKEIIKDLARIIGVTKYHIRKILNCQVGESGYLNVNQLSAVARYFNCSIDDLLSEDLHTSSFTSTGTPRTSAPVDSSDSI